MRRNPALILKLYEAISARDGATIQELSDPNIQVQQSVELPWGGEYHGVAEAMRFFHLVQEHLDSQVTPEQVIDAGDRVAVVGRTAGTVLRNGQTFSVPLVHLWTVRDGRVSALSVLLDNPSMLSALQAAAE